MVLGKAVWPRFIARISRGRSRSWVFAVVRTAVLTWGFCSLRSVVVRFGIVHTAEVEGSSPPSPTSKDAGQRSYLCVGGSRVLESGAQTAGHCEPLKATEKLWKRAGVGSLPGEGNSVST
jgi:hypothetical protein